jgi:hypothetical protein
MGVCRWYSNLSIWCVGVVGSFWGLGLRLGVDGCGDIVVGDMDDDDRWGIVPDSWGILI